jgi:hypothetical protein
MSRIVWSDELVAIWKSAYEVVWNGRQPGNQFSGQLKEFRCGMLTSGQQRDHGSWRISIDKIRYQETSSKNTAEE